MATNHYFSGDSVTSCLDGGSDGSVLTLTGAGPQTAQRVGTIAVRALGTVTAFDVYISKNDGATSVGRVGASTALPVGGAVFRFDPPLNCAKNDNAKITVTATGATGGTVVITANYKLGA